MSAPARGLTGWDQGRALLVLLAFTLAFVLATPGLDTAAPDALATRGQQAEAGKVWPSTVVGAASRLAAFNRAYRLPVVNALAPLEVPFRVKQGWSLYRDGASRVMRLEIRVDGTVVSRTGDPARAWLQGPLTHRRLRPLVEQWVKDEHAPNVRGLERWVAQAAARDFRGGERIVLAAMWGDWPGAVMVEHHQREVSP